MNTNFKHVLFTSDLMEGSRFVFDFALVLADRYQADMTILHVLPEVPDSISGALQAILSKSQLDDLRGKLKGEAITSLTGKSMHRRIIREGMTNYWQDRAQDKHQIEMKSDEVLVREGDVEKEILAVAEERGCDIIVMGSPQYGQVKDTLRGSPLRGVLKKAKVPVLVVPLPEELK